jgi:hypothetical protein
MGFRKLLCVSSRFVADWRLLEAASSKRARFAAHLLDFKLTEGRWSEGGGANKSRLH